MDEKDLPSSDESDADFVPKEEDYKSDSGSEKWDSEASENEDKTTKSRKRKKGGTKSNKKAKTSKTEEEEEEDDDSIIKEDKKIDVDALWADFKKDVNSTEIKKTVDSSEANSNLGTENKGSEPSQNSNEKTSVTSKPKGIANFSNRNKPGGLSKVLNQIGKKDKMSTLQKSQLDWNKFKKTEGIEEEIKTYNKGKDGYLEKQDFLQRTDLRQFEIEKDLRSSRRKF